MNHVLHSTNEEEAWTAISVVDEVNLTLKHTMRTAAAAIRGLETEDDVTVNSIATMLENAVDNWEQAEQVFCRQYENVLQEKGACHEG